MMIAYKLLRVRKDGKGLSPLFINKQSITPIGVWLEAEFYPTKGFKENKGWHTCLKPEAPHLKTKLKSGEVRVWCEVEIKDYKLYNKPESQGGVWALANWMKVNKIL